MTYAIVWTENALDGVAEVADFVAQRSDEAATALVQRLFERVDSLGALPRLGPPWPRSANPDLRQLVEGRHLVIYQVDDADRRIVVLAVRDARRRALDPSELG